MLAFFKSYLRISYDQGDLDARMARGRLDTKIPLRVVVINVVGPVHVEGRLHLVGVESYCWGKSHMDWTALIAWTQQLLSYQEIVAFSSS